MIQDIDPSRLNNTFSPQDPRAEDNVLLFDRDGKLNAADLSLMKRAAATFRTAAPSTCFQWTMFVTSAFWNRLRLPFPGLNSEPCGNCGMPAAEKSFLQHSPRTTCGDGMPTTGAAVGAAGQMTAIPRNGPCSADAAGT